MLILTRRQGETLRVGDDVAITVLAAPHEYETYPIDSDIAVVDARPARDKDSRSGNFSVTEYRLVPELRDSYSSRSHGLPARIRQATRRKRCNGRLNSSRLMQGNVDVLETGPQFLNMLSRGVLIAPAALE